MPARTFSRRSPQGSTDSLGAPAEHTAATVLEDPQRLAALTRTGLADSPQEESFDRFTRLAARLLAAPVALVTLLDGRRQFIKSQVGLPEPWAGARETPLSHSFCRHVVAGGEPLVVTDAMTDLRVCDNPAVSEYGVRAYAGAPIRTGDGHTLGSLCVIDAEPRQWTEVELATLGDLAEAVSTEVRLRDALTTSVGAERLLRLAVDAADLGTWTWDPAGALLSGDARFARLLSGPVGRRASVAEWLRCARKEDRAVLDEALSRAAHRGEPVGVELRVRSGDGSWRWIQFRGQALQDDPTRAVEVSGICLDTTAAASSADQVARALEQVTDAFVAVDSQWRYTYLNREAERVLKRSAKDLLGQVMWQEFPGLVGSAFEREYRRAARDQRPVDVEEFYAPLGRWFHARAYPSPDGLAVYFLDVTDRRALAEERVALAARQAQQAERELRMAQLSKALEQLRQAAGREGAFARIAEGMAYAEDLAETLDRAASVLVDLTDMVACAIVLTDDDSHRATVAGARRLPAQYLDAMRAAMAAGADVPALRALRNQEPVLVAKVADLPLFGGLTPPTGEDDEIQAVCVPLTSRGRPMGVLQAFYVPGQDLGDRQRFVEAIADQVAVAVDNARLVRQAQEKVALEERQRLSRELHDSLTQTLFSMSLLARGAQLGFAREGGNGGSSVGRALAELAELTRTALAETRSLILELRPALLAEEGLLTALRRRATALSRQDGLRVELLGPAERIPLAEEVEEHLYRIAQEALHNAVRHAQAGRITIRVDVSGQPPCRCTVEVADDGVGFDPGDIGPARLGLRSMAERARAAGGDLRIVSSLGTGTTVRATVPCGPA